MPLCKAKAEGIALRLAEAGATAAAMRSSFADRREHGLTIRELMAPR